MIYKDQLNRRIHIEKLPERIISLVPSQTELLVELGLKTSIVGVTKFCVHPGNLRQEKDIVGGTKQIHLDKIKALNPDIILCNKEENTLEMITELESIAPVHISDIYNLVDALRLIEMYGELFNVEAESTKLITAITNERETFKLKFQNRTKKKAAYFIWKNPWMVAGSNTFIDFMLNEAGFDNVFKHMERYPEISLEDQSLKEAEVLLLSSEPFPFKDTDKEAFFDKCTNQQVLIVDGELFSWYGSRLLYSYRYYGMIIKNLLTF